MHFPHPAAPAWVCCLRTLSRSLPRLSCVFSRWGFRVCLLLFLSCSWACLSASAFQSPALFSEQRSPWFRFAGPSLPPSLPLFRGRGGRGSLRCRSLVPLSPPTPPRAPTARRRLRGMSPQHPGIAWGSESPSWQPPEEILPSVSPFLCGRGRVASRRSAAEAPGRARAFGRPARWRPRRPATATRPRDVRVACREPPGGRLYIVPPLWSFGEASFRRIVTQPLGPRQSSQTPATLAATVPVAPRPRDSPAVAGDWFSRFLRRVTVAAHRSRLAGRPDRVDQHLPVPLRPRRRTARTLPGPGRRGGQGEGLPCPERLDSGSAVRTPPGPPSGACASPSAPLRRWGPARTVAWRSPEGAPGSGPSGPSCPRCFPRRAPEVGTRGLTGGGACAVPPVGSGRPSRLPAPMLSLCQSPDGSGDVDGPDPASAGGRGGRARPSGVPSWVSVVGRDFGSPLSDSLNPSQSGGGDRLGPSWVPHLGRSGSRPGAVPGRGPLVSLEAPR